MRVIGVAGWSGAGKTTLIAALIPLFRARGLSVSTIKHAHHGFDIDRPGKDSFLHREAGASEVLVASGRRWAIMHEVRDEEPEPDLGTLLGRMAEVDLVLVEGFKRDAYRKIEVHRVGNGKPFLFPEDRSVVALASDAPPPFGPLPRVDIADIAAVAALIETLASPVDEIARRLAAR